MQVNVIVNTFVTVTKMIQGMIKQALSYGSKREGGRRRKKREEREREERERGERRGEGGEKVQLSFVPTN